MSEQEIQTTGLNSAQLKWIAMFAMLLDHSYATIANNQLWMNAIGRIAMPIFAFLLVEGYFHTHDIKRYLLRLAVFALLSELPFNLMVSGQLYYPYYQNVMITLFLGLLAITGIEACRKMTQKWQGIIFSILIILFSCYIAALVMCDYWYYGVITVLIFYFTRDIRYGRLLQLISLFYLNVYLLGGYGIHLTVFNQIIRIPIQGFAILSLPLLWQYNKEKGLRNKLINLFCYAFYPLHMLILALLHLS